MSKQNKKNFNISSPSIVSIPDKCKSVQAGPTHSYAIGELGIYFWGHNQKIFHNQTHNNTGASGERDKSADGKLEFWPLLVDQISTGSSHCFAWRNNEVYCRGSNHVYQLGLEEEREYEWHQVKLFEQAFDSGYKLREISCGDHHTLAIFKFQGVIEENKSINEIYPEEVYQTNQEEEDNQAKLFAWGQSQSYQLTLNTLNIIPYPVLSTCTFRHFEKLYSRSDYNIALCNGKAYSWGCNMFSRLGLTKNDNNQTISNPAQLPKVRIPKRVHLNKQIIKVGLGTYHVVAITASGEAFSWGKGNQGQLGTGKFQTEGKPNKMVCQQIIVDASCGDAHSLVLLKDGRLKSCGSNHLQVLGHEKYQQSDKKKRCKILQFVQNIETIGKIVAISSGNNHNLILNSDGAIFSWGNNDYFQSIPQTTDSKKQKIPKGPRYLRKSLELIIDEQDGSKQQKMDGLEQLNRSNQSYTDKIIDWKRRYDKFKQQKRKQQDILLRQFDEIMKNINKNV